MRGALALLLVLPACQQDPAATTGDGPGSVNRGGASVTLGAASVWLASTEQPPVDPKYFESRAAAEIEGVVTALDSGPADPPRGLQPFFPGTGASQVLSIQSDTGLDWKLGYRIERGKPTRDVTPDLRSLVGSRVRLLFRAIRGFGTAAAFVLSDARGVVFALDLAGWGDPWNGDDIPGLTLTDGTTTAHETNDCFDSRHTALIFQADNAVEVPPGNEGTLTLSATPYTAINLFNWEAEGTVIRCTDIAGKSRAWTLWRH